MVKILTSLNKFLLKRQISNIEYKISFIDAYLPIYLAKLNARLDQKVSNLKEKHQETLLQFEIDTLSNQDYQKYKTNELLEKLKKTYYWKKRAVNQKINRLELKTKDQEIIDDLNKKRALKLKALDQELLDKETQILNANQRHTDDAELKQKKIQYEQEKQKYHQALNEFKNPLVDQLKLTYEAYETKMIHKQNNLKEKLSQAQKKLASILENESIQNMLHEKLGQDEILKIENLSMQFGGLKAVDNLTFAVKKGEIFGLIGPNGAGKTTVFNCITQFYKSSSGDIYYQNSNHEVVSLNNYKVHDVVKQGITRTFQNVELIWELNILDNMLVGAHSLYKSNFLDQSLHLLRLKREEEILKAKALNILTDLGLFVYKDFYPLGLPYGILKKIELARTLMTNPSLIILDEPAAGLNDLETKELAKTIKKIQKDYDCTIFLVEHDMELVMEICDTICAISFGKKLAIGTPIEIKKNPVVQEAYLGGE